MTIRVFTYSCRAPERDDFDIVDSQMQLASVYRNKLVEIELQRRTAYRSVMSSIGDVEAMEGEILECESRLDELRTQIKAARARSKTRAQQSAASVEARELRAKSAALRAQAKSLRRAAKEDPTVAQALEEVDSTAQIAVKQARAACGVYWGTYLSVERAIDRARQNQRDPRFRRWRGEGKIAVQVQGGASVSDIFSGRCGMLQIDALPADQWDTRSGRRAARTTVRFRIGSTKSRRPVWVSFPLLIHRPLPPDGIIKEAYVTRRRLARSDTWALQLVVRAPSIAPERSNGPIAAVHFGWRQRPRGLRVCVLVDEFRQRKEYILPQIMIERMRHSESIRGIRDRAVEVFRPELVRLLDRIEPAVMLSWFTSLELASINRWRSAHRFSAFVLAWKAARGKAPRSARSKEERDAFRFAEAWRRQDLHLLQWEDHERRGALAFRKKLYEGIAAELGRKYSHLVMEKFDLRSIARKSRPEDQETREKPARQNRNLAAIGSLRGCIQQKCQTVTVEAAENSRTCSRCRSLETLDSRSLRHTCAVCGRTWDQDYNAARNALRKYASDAQD